MTGGGNQNPNGLTACSCKIGRIAEKYSLTDLDTDLRRRHRGDASLRDLERYVNVTILEQALRDADVDVIGSVDSVHDTLTDDAASAGERTEVRGRLATAGIDIEALESDFVSYQTVRTHLRDCSGIDTGGRKKFSLSDARGTIEWSRTRNDAVIERTLDRLRQQGELEIGPIEVSGFVRVTCAICGGTYAVDDLLTRGQCDCRESDQP